MHNSCDLESSAEANSSIDADKLLKDCAGLHTTAVMPKLPQMLCKSCMLNSSEVSRGLFHILADEVFFMYWLMRSVCLMHIHVEG